MAGEGPLHVDAHARRAREVSVRDFVRKKTITLRKGKRYTARAANP
jgi:hypothetical protein